MLLLLARHPRGNFNQNEHETIYDFGEMQMVVGIIEMMTALDCCNKFSRCQEIGITQIFSRWVSGS